MNAKRPGMKWYLKLLVIAAVTVLVLYIGGMVYLVRAKYEMNAYQRRMDAAFSAATRVNAGQICMQPEKAVIARYGDQACVIDPENYKALKSYLLRDHAMPLVGRVDRTRALHICICGSDDLYIMGDDDGQGVMIRFESADSEFIMHAAGGDLWQKILDISIDGSYRAENHPI